MYRIYVRETPILLSRTEALPQPGAEKEILRARYTGQRKSILQYVDMLEKTDRFEAVWLHHDDLPRLWADFQSHFRLVEASGGVIRNPEGKIMVIFRRGFWDLPKGKIDPGETPEQAAVREVMEETGLRQPELQAFFMPTWHTYREGKKRFLKHTYWYRMQGEQEVLEPEAREQIEKAEWVDLPAFLRTAPRLHANIRMLLENYRRSADLE